MAAASEHSQQLKKHTYQVGMYSTLDANSPKSVKAQMELGTCQYEHVVGHWETVSAVLAGREGVR